MSTAREINTKISSIKNTQKINALNIGLSDGKKLYTFCYYTMHPEYYNLQSCRTSGKIIVCSEKIGENNFENLDIENVLKT